MQFKARFLLSALLAISLTACAGGVFDWWGYSNQADPNYALKSALQMSVLHPMVRHVTGRP